MARVWVNEPWRKLYCRPTGAWLKLSVSARGLGSELIKYADDMGVIADCGAEDPGLTIAFMLGARPREHRRIHEDIAELLRDGYLACDEGVLKIRNFVDAQERRSPVAIRVARHREKRRLEQYEAIDEDPREALHVTREETLHGNSHVTGNESKRIETIRSAELKEPRARARMDGYPPGWFVTAWCQRAQIAMVAAATLSSPFAKVLEYAAATQVSPETAAHTLLDAYPRVTADWETKYPWEPHLFVRHFDKVQSAAARPRDSGGRERRDVAEVRRLEEQRRREGSE